MTIRFLLDLPPRELSPNGQHGHWSRVARARQAYRRACFIDSVKWGAQMAPAKRRISLVFGIQGGRKYRLYQPRDVPNAVSAFKAGFDGLRDSGVLVDDSRTWMELGSVEIDPYHGPWVRVTVESIDD